MGYNMKKKAYELNEVIEKLGLIQETTEDISHRLEVIYDLGPELEHRELDEIGGILEAVSDVIDDFYYELIQYMDGTGIDSNSEEEDLSVSSPMGEFMEENLEWENEPEEEELYLSDDEEEKPNFLR